MTAKLILFGDRAARERSPHVSRMVYFRITRCWLGTRRNTGHIPFPILEIEPSESAEMIDMLIRSSEISV